MKLFTIIVTNRSEGRADRLVRTLSSIHTDKPVHISRRAAESHTEIEVSGVLPSFRLREDGEAVFRLAADAVACHVLEEEEGGLLTRLIRKEYDDEDDCAKIMTYCRQMLTGLECDMPPESEPWQRRKAKVADAVLDYLRENTELHLDGFIRFRLRAYAEELQDIVEYAVDEFVMDRQHQEFISLLQYFVYIQEAKIPFVHLLHKGGSEFSLLNDRMELVETDDSDAVVTVETLEKDMNFEDMIVSTLITVSPQKIYIHTREPETQVIKTIGQIFENRVELCDYCRLCVHLDRSPAAEYNKR